MPTLLARARALGAAPTRRARRPTASRAREVDILRLVAAGRSNREIGAELFISEHTVANHVRSILRKTGRANRTEAAGVRLSPRLGRGRGRRVSDRPMPVYVIERNFAEQLDMSSDEVEPARGDQRRRGRELAVLLPERRPPPLVLPLRGAEPRRDHRRRQARRHSRRRGHRGQPHHRGHVPLTRPRPAARPRTLPAMRASAGTVLREWGRLGCIGFGGPPTHIALLRELCVARRGWLSDREFEDAIAACNLLPGPASTQLAIFCAWRVRGAVGAVVGGLGFVVPGLVAMLALAAIFLAGSPPDWIRGAGAGGGAAVAAVAVHAGREPRAGELPAGARGGAVALGRRTCCSASRRPRRSGRGSCCCSPRAGRSRSWCGARRRRGLGATPCRARVAGAARGRGSADRRARRRRVGRAEGRRAVLRRRLRDRPADAGRRGRPLRLDDRRAVPERRRARAGHAGAGDPHGDGGRLRRRRGRRCAARRRGRVRAVVPLRARRRAPVRRPAREPGRARVPRRRRPGGDRGDPRLGGRARRGALRGVAVRGARRRRGAAARRAARVVATLLLAAAAGVVVALAGGPLPR